MGYPKPLIPPSLSTTKVSLTNITTSHEGIEVTSPDSGRPRLVRKKSGEVVKSALKSDHHHNGKAVSFPTKAQLVRVRSYDKLECPQSVSGYIPMSMKVINFSTNYELLEKSEVCLEKVDLNLDKSTIVGLIRVKNLAFDKAVNIRFTLDHWNTVDLIPCKYLRSIYMTTTPQDHFLMELEIPPHLRVSNDPDACFSIKFAIQYKVNGQEYWDNNQGRNYLLEIIPNIEVDPDYLDEFSDDTDALWIKPVKRSSSVDFGFSMSPEPVSMEDLANSPFNSEFSNRYKNDNNYLKKDRPKATFDMGSPTEWSPTGENMVQGYSETGSGKSTFNHEYLTTIDPGLSSNTQGLGWAKSNPSFFDYIPMKEPKRSPLPT